MENGNRFDKHGPPDELRAQRDALWKALKHNRRRLEMEPRKRCGCATCVEVFAAIAYAYDRPEGGK